jgi:hypothetical protein
MKFKGNLALDGKTATGITVPMKVIDSLGGGNRSDVMVA